MILETIVTTQNSKGLVHIAPMGIHVVESGYIIQPFRPSTTLNNLLETQVGVINFCDDVRIFAGCLTGRRDWPLKSTSVVAGSFLADALVHSEIEISRIEEDSTRPKLYGKVVHVGNHAPFQGFNRAQFSVLEAAILLSRLEMLPWSKIASEIEYLQIGLQKTAGGRELEAWEWIMTAIDTFKIKNSL